MLVAEKKKTSKRAQKLVMRAKYASGNHRYGLARMPKGHWMRKDQARRVRAVRTDRFGHSTRGILPGVVS